MLPKKYKLKKDKDFRRIFEKGRSYYRDFLGLKRLRNDLGLSRFAFLVGLKISKKAVIRNKIRRQLEETVRLNLAQIKTGYDMIFMVKPEIIDKKYEQIKETLIKLLKKACLNQ